MPDLVNTPPANLAMNFDEPYSAVSTTDDFFIENENGILGQNFPNPASREIIIPYELKKSGEVVSSCVGHLEGARHMKKLQGVHQYEIQPMIW